MKFQAELEFAMRTAHEAGVVMRKYMYADQKRSVKSDGTPLTIADRLINDLVIHELEKAFPGDGLIGEERSTAKYGMGRRWICDPIDGTKAFTWGVPTAMFSLALVIDGRPVVGVCLEPMLGRMYHAVEEEGAFLNDRPINVNDSPLKDGILAIASGPEDIRSNPIVGRILDSGQTTAIFSGAVYKALGVADGRFVGYIEHKVNAYDIAAVDVIVTEAGGRVTSLEGSRHDYSQPLKGVVISNGSVHQPLLKLVNSTA